MIGQPSLRKVVGTDPLAAIAGTDHRAPGIRVLLRRPLLLGLGVSAVLLLSAFRYARTAELEIASRAPLWRMAEDLKARSVPGDLVVVLEFGLILGWGIK